MKKVSLVVAIRNQENKLAPFIEQLLGFEFPKEDIEILIIDGDSEDPSIDITRRFQKNHPSIHVFNNKEKEKVFGLNMGIKEAKGAYIFFMDIQTQYPSDYVEQMISYMEGDKADKIAGKWIIKSPRTSLINESISAAMESQFLVGNAPFRMQASEICETNILPSGCYRKETFDKYGLFDEELLENYEYEMSARIAKNGGKALLIPQIELPYLGPENIGEAMQSFYRIAYFKPLENEKLKASASTRQMAPGLILIFFAFTAITSMMSPLMLFLFIFGGMVYLFGDIWESFGIGIIKDKARLTTVLLFIFPLLHISYGLGYIQGLWRRRMNDKKKSIA